MKATPTSIASDSNDISTASFSEAGDGMMTSSAQKGKLLKKMNLNLIKTYQRAKPPP